MIYEGTIQFVSVDKNGNDKVYKEKYLLENYETFGSVEETLLTTFEALTDIDVVAIKRSQLKEIINEHPAGTNDCRIFYATIVDKFYDADKDETTETKYVVALFAMDIKQAHQIVNDYMKQGLEDMELVGLKCTKYLSVL